MERQNLNNPSSRFKHEPPVEFVLILPRPTYGWRGIKKEEDDKQKWWVNSVELTKFDAKLRRKLKLFQTYFICPKCQLVMKRNYELTEHLKACGIIKPAKFECDICGKRFQMKTRMRNHMSTHSSERKFFCCNKCGSGFTTKGSLLHHSRSKKINKCADCDVQFSCFPLLVRHRDEIHGNVFKCDKCPYQTKFKGGLKLHKGIHNKPFACGTCQKKFSINPQLKSHQMQHKHGIYTTAPDETFDCDECDKSFSTPQGLRQHQKHVHDENEVKCKVCNKIFKNRLKLNEHSRMHVKVECSICHQKISKPIIAYHIRMHSSEKRLICDCCGYSTNSKNSLKIHIKRSHLLKKLLHDSNCGGNFNDVELLKKLQLKYGKFDKSSEKKFKCDKCDKFFVCPMLMIKHKGRVHPKKLHECEICKRAFKTNSHLMRHTKLVHSGVTQYLQEELPVEFVPIPPAPTYDWRASRQEKDGKPIRWVKTVTLTKFDKNQQGKSNLFQTFLTCPKCRLAMKRNYDMTRHLKACGRIKPAKFDCDICGKRFPMKCLMRPHMLKHSSERKFFCCHKCGHGFTTKGSLLHHTRSKKIQKCVDCDVSFSCFPLLARHRNEFHRNVFNCDKCSYQAKSRPSFMAHKRTHDKSFTCETCQHKFAEKISLKLHQMHHKHGIFASTPEETFDCEKCNKSFSTPLYRKIHQTHVHDAEEVKCQVCDKICKNRKKLHSHKLTHIRVKCPICHKTITKASKQRHLRTHSTEDPFKCDFCGCLCNTKCSLKQHMGALHLLNMLAHDSKRRDDLEGFDQIRIESHMKFHSLGNLFECDRCDYKSENKKNLVSHLKRMHRKRNGGLTCHLRCKGKFANFRKLFEHQKIHIGNRQWKCVACDFQTTSQRLLLQHITKHKI